MKKELAILLKTLNRRVERLTQEVEGDYPSIIIKQEISLVREAVNSIEEKLIEKVEEK